MKFVNPCNQARRLKSRIIENGLYSPNVDKIFSALTIGQRLKAFRLINISHAVMYIALLIAFY